MRPALFVLGLALALFLPARSVESGSPVRGMLPAGARLVRVAQVDPGGVVAVDRGGWRVAYQDGGVRIRNLATGRVHEATPRTPLQLAWSTDGTTLAAAFEEHGNGLLQRYDVQGHLRGQASVSGRICGLQWRPDGTLLALGLDVQHFRFGTRLVQVLYLWTGTGEPRARTLGEDTLMPGVAARVEASLPGELAFAVSPLGDELLYTRLDCPPALSPRLRLELYHLDLGRERTLAEVPLGAGAAEFSGIGDRIVYGDGTLCWVVDPWSGRTLASYSGPGREVAVSASGRWLLLDGVLRHDGRPVDTFPAGAWGIFPCPGLGFVVVGTDLYRLSGLSEDPVPALGARVRELRRWLDGGLITAEDYRHQIARGTP